MHDRNELVLDYCLVFLHNFNWSFDLFKHKAFFLPWGNIWALCCDGKHGDPACSRWMKFQLGYLSNKSNENVDGKKCSNKEENAQLKVDCLKLTDSARRTDPIHFSNPHINKRTLKRYRKCTKLLLSFYVNREL